MTQSRQLRFVEVDNGHWRVGWYDGALATLVPILGHAIWTTLLVAGMIASLYNVVLAAGLLAASAAAVAWTVHEIGDHYRLIEIDAQGLTLTTLKLRQVVTPTQLSVDTLRNPPVSSHYLTGGPPEPERTLYVDVADMGCTDFSIWFQDDVGERSELRLDEFTREDIARLFDRIAPSWKHARAGLQEDLESTHRSAAQLRALAGS